MNEIEATTREHQIKTIKNYTYQCGLIQENWILRNPGCSDRWIWTIYASAVDPPWSHGPARGAADAPPPHRRPHHLPRRPPSKTPPPTPPFNPTPGRRGPAMEGHLRHLYPFRLYWHNRRLPNPRPSRLPTISHPHPSPPHRPKPLLLNPLLREGNTELRGRRYQAEIEADIELSGGELWAEWGCRHHEVCAAIPGQVRDVRQLNKLVTTV